MHRGDLGDWGLHLQDGKNKERNQGGKGLGEMRVDRKQDEL